MPLTSPVNDVLTAVIGIGGKNTTLDAGLGTATLHQANMVARYAQLLAKINDPQLRERLEF